MMDDENRLARLEFRAQDLTDSFKEHRETTEKALQEIRDELSNLLALRNKGAGVLWIITSVLGAGLINGFAHLLKFIGFN